MGIYVFGSNANVGFIGYCQVLGPGSFTEGLGGHGFWDHSLSGCLWINDSVCKTSWINNVSEMPVPNIVRQGAVTSLGPSPWHPTMAQQLSHFDLHEGSQLATTDCTSRVTGFTQRGFQGWVDKIIVTQAGTKGHPWKPDWEYKEKRVGTWNQPADIVEPGDGFAYACTRPGKSGEGDPPFVAVGQLGPNAPVWKANTTLLAEVQGSPRCAQEIGSEEKVTVIRSKKGRKYETTRRLGSTPFGGTALRHARNPKR